MKGKDLIEIITKAVPDSETWYKGEPYGPYNVDPNKEYTKLLYCVTPTQEVCQFFRENNYDALISHHPFHVDSDIPVFFLHTAFDCCKGGLNDMWRDFLGIKDAKHFDRNLGWYGKVEPIGVNDLVDKVRVFVGGIDGQLYCKDPRKPIESIVVCSGLGGLVMDQALKTGADCYIMGENVIKASETGFRMIIEVGHTKSEIIGVNFFRDLLPSCKVDIAPEGADYHNLDVFELDEI